MNPWTDCSDPPEESCSDAGCPIHGWTDDSDNPMADFIPNDWSGETL